MIIRQNIFRNGILFLFFSFLFFSCEQSESLSDKERVSFEKKVIESKEFKSYVDAFSLVQNIDNQIIEKFNEAEKKGIVNKEDLKNYFFNNTNIHKKGSNLSFLDKIGIKNSNNILDKRKKIFQNEIGIAIKALGEKYPKLKTYSSTNFENLVSTYKTLNNEK